MTEIKINESNLVIIDPNIHKQAKVTREEFLSRVENVDFIRTRTFADYLTFYIKDINEFNRIENFHKLVNIGKFNFQDYVFNYHIYAVSIAPKLYYWFKNNEISTIQKQIINWLAATYHFGGNVKGFRNMKEQLYKPLFEEINF